MRSLVISAFAASAVASQLPLTDPHSFRPGVLSDLPHYIDEVAREFKIPGLSIAIVKVNEDEPEFYNWGIRSEDGNKSSDETLYCIASNSKAFTAISLGILIDDFKHGRNVTSLPPGVELDWTTKAADLLQEEWKLQDDWASSKASLIDMLSHVTGLPRHDLSYAPGMPLADLVHRLRYLRPTYEFREKFQYNNQMYATASYIVSKYAGQSYLSFVKERIFEPFGMNSSTFLVQDAFDSGKLAENWVNTAGPWFNETRKIPYFIQDWSQATLELNAGPGGIISSTKDLTRWVRALLSGGKNPNGGEQIIPKSVLDTVMTGQSVQSGTAMFPELSAAVYGAGWERWSYQGHEVVQHGGSVPGFSSAITLLPNDGVGVILLSNGYELGYVLLALTARVIEDLFELEHIDWPGRFRDITGAELEHAHSVKKANPDLSGEPPAVSTFVGTYANTGYYTNFTLCAWPADKGTACKDVLAVYELVDPDFETTKTFTLYAAWPRVWTTNFKLEQRGNNTFAIMSDSIFKEGCGNDASPFFVRNNPRGDGLAEFGIKDGVVTGMGVWGIGAGPRDRVPREPEKSSEVWFARIA